MVRPVCTLPIDFPEPLFRPVDGHVEVRVAEAAEASLPRPRRVTSIIAAMCERLESYPAEEEQVRRVSAAGREWLLQQSKELKAAGVPILHYYTLGKPHMVVNVVKEIV